MSQTMKAVVAVEGKKTEVQEKPIPKNLGADEALFKVVAIGQNPTDWKHIAGFAKPGDIAGCDFVGVATELGSSVPEKVEGQLRGGFVRGGVSQENGAFAEYVKAPWETTFVVPSNITPQEAASAPIPLFTACQAFYLRLGLPRPNQDTSSVSGKWLLVWSGSTAVGQYAIQLAKLSGLKVATTASPNKHDLVKSLGADVVFDYKDDEAPKKLREATNDGIVYGLDTIAENGSIQKAQKAFSEKGGHLICTLFDLKDLPRPEVKTESTLVYTAACGDQSFGPANFPSSKEDRENQVECAKLVSTLFEQGKLKPLKVTDLGGFDTVQKGLDMIKNAQHPGKIVHTLASV